MATIIEASIPIEDFALTDTLQTCSDATIECEQLVEHPDERVMPLVWVRNTSPDAFEAALEQDPTVETYTQLAASPTECLYEMDWRSNIQLVLQFFTIEGAVILDTVGSIDGWHLRVLFPERDDVRATTDFCETHNLTITLQTIRQLGDDAANQGAIRAGLTPDQHEALTNAYQGGYFAVPRDADLEAIATEMDISHQALSERLRRAHETLIEETLVSMSDSGPDAQQHAASGAPTDDTDDSDAPPMDD
jgi:predicted DNA binding protein